MRRKLRRRLSAFVLPVRIRGPPARAFANRGATENPAVQRDIQRASSERRGSHRPGPLRTARYMPPFRRDPSRSSALRPLCFFHSSASPSASCGRSYAVPAVVALLTIERPVAANWTLRVASLTAGHPMQCVPCALRWALVAGDVTHREPMPQGVHLFKSPKTLKRCSSLNSSLIFALTDFHSLGSTNKSSLKHVSSSKIRHAGGQVPTEPTSNSRNSPCRSRCGRDGSERPRTGSLRLLCEALPAPASGSHR